MRPGCCSVHSGSLGSPGYDLGVVGFILGRWVHWCAPCWSTGSFGVVGFTWVRPGCRRVHSGRCVHAGRAWKLSGSFGVVGFTLVRPGGRSVHSGSFGSLVYALVVVEFIQGTP